jgi:homoserine O-acetyltransferase
MGRAGTPCHRDIASTDRGALGHHPSPESSMSLTHSPSAIDAAVGGDTDFAVRSTPSYFRAAEQRGAARGSVDAVLAFRHAGTRRVQIRWECQGPVDASVLIVQGGISADRHVASSAQFVAPGWWQAQAGAGAMLDTDRYRLLAIDWLGADGRLDFCIDPADQAEAIRAVLDELGIARAAAFIGASYGAMVGLQFAAHHGQRIERLIAISGAHRTHAQTTALRVIQRRIVQLGRDNGAADAGLALARALALIGYRSGEEFAGRFDAAPSFTDGRARFASEDYFDAVGAKFVTRFGTDAYLRLSESIDLQCVDPAAIRVPLDIVAVRQDQIVPVADLEALAAGAGARCRLHRIDSIYGHDAFLKEVAAIAAILRVALDGSAA